MREVWKEIVFAARWSPRMYFAPFVGAWRGAKEEMARVHQSMRTAQEDSP